MLHSDVDDGIINCGGELTDAAQEMDIDGRPCSSYAVLVAK